MRPLRGNYWTARTNISANWWLRRYVLRTAGRFLRYAFLASRGRLIVMDERLVESRGGYISLQMDLSPFPMERQDDPAEGTLAGEAAD